MLRTDGFASTMDCVREGVSQQVSTSEPVRAVPSSRQSSQRSDVQLKPPAVEGTPLYHMFRSRSFLSCQHTHHYTYCTVLPASLIPPGIFQRTDLPVKVYLFLSFSSSSSSSTNRLTPPARPGGGGGGGKADRGREHAYSSSSNPPKKLLGHAAGWLPLCSPSAAAIILTCWGRACGQESRRDRERKK